MLSFNPWTSLNHHNFYIFVGVLIGFRSYCVPFSNIWSMFVQYSLSHSKWMGMILAHAKHGSTLNRNYIFLLTRSRSLNVKLVTCPFMFLSKHQSIQIPSYYVLVFSSDILILWTCFFMEKTLLLPKREKTYYIPKDNPRQPKKDYK